jgi:DNA-binding CsgD family transcriptional regulator
MRVLRFLETPISKGKVQEPCSRAGLETPGLEAVVNQEGETMSEQTIRLGRREQQIVELLLQGCDNADIAKQLNMARRTVKAHFNRLFLRFGITSGIKRVKLATLLYRRQQWLEKNGTAQGNQIQEKSESLNSLHKGSKTKKLRTKSEPPNTSSKITYELSTTSSDSGTVSNSPSGTKQDSSNKSPMLEGIEAWEHRLMHLEKTGYETASAD